MNAKKAAISLLNQGIASIPIHTSESKRPPRGVMWRDLNSSNYSESTINKIFSEPHQAFAVMGGYVSAGLEILDIDLKNSRSPEQLWTDLTTNIEAALPDFYQNCTIAKTPSGGYHMYYQCFEVKGTLKLAKEVTDGKGLDVIETRGDGGYALTYPSPGYELIQGSIDSFAYILDPEERDILHDICQIFDERKEDEQHKQVYKFVPKGNNFISNPFDDYNRKVPFHEVEDLIFKAGFEKPKNRGQKVFYKRIGSTNEQGANWHHGKALFYPFTDNSMLEGGRAYTPATLLRLINFNGDGKECYKWLIKNGYGERIQADDEPYIHDAYQAMNTGSDKEAVKADLAKKNVTPERAEKYIEIAQNRMIRMEYFWEEDEKGKVSIDIVRLKHFLENRGFRKYRFSSGDQESILVHICEEKHRIKEIDIEYVKEFLEEYLLDESLALPVKLQEDVLRSLMNMTTRFFKDSMFEWLESVIEDQDVKIKKDTINASYFFFDNQFIKITAKKPQIHSYDSFDDREMLWSKDVIKKDISLINIEENANESEYFRFIKRLVLLGPDTDDMSMKEIEKSHPDEYEKLRAFITTIGYLCHRFNDRKRPWAVIIAEDILNSSEGGGTGKGIFMNSLSKVRKAVYEAGKSFDPTRQFAFQKWEPGTDIYLIDDVSRKFDFESMYNFITDGGSIERKFQRAIPLPFSKLPKFIFSTNYGDMADGNTHGERRRKLLLVGKYYGEHLTPYQEFGHNLFSEWDHEQWNLFYNFIFYCIQQYLELGGVRDFPSSDNVKIKTFLSDYGSELFEFFEELKSRHWAFPVLLSELRNEFHNSYERKNFSAQLFKIALDKFCRMFEIEIEEVMATNRANRGSKKIKLICSGSSKERLPNIEEENERNVDDLPF